jgi:energy-coupling factor transporter ATP-binding protein EcfA2
MHQALTLEPFIAVLALVVIFGQPMPASSQPRPSEPSKAVPSLGVTPQFIQPGKAVRILGVSPQVIEPGARVLIILSESIEPVSTLGVEIGGRPADIVKINQGAITVFAPKNLPIGSPLKIRIIGMGLDLETTPGQEVIAETPGVPAFLRNDRVLLPIGLAGAVLGSAGLLLWRNRRRERALVSRLESLQFRLERHQVPPPAAAPTPAESAGPRATKAQAPSPLPDVPSGLIEAINRGECTLFWGGGLSAQAGYPTWRQALSEMIERTAPDAETSPRVELQQSLNAGRFSLVVELLATRLGRDKVISELVRLWGAPRATTPAIDALARLRFTNAVTSVWDPLIDQAFAHRRPVVVTGVSSESLETLLSGEAFCLVRLWGALTRPESVQFTPNEFRGAVAGNPTYAKYVASLVLSQSHLFMGASLDAIEEYLSATPRHASSRTHYALVAENDAIDLSREVFKARYGVELLVFRPTPGWPELPAFVTELAQAVAARAPATPPVGIEAFRLVAVKLENVGPFKTLSLDLNQNWNVLLGNNGSGKSTLLRAIALVLCGDDSRALIEGGRLLRTGATNGAVELMVGRDIYRTELSRDKSGAVHVNVGNRVSPLKTGRWVALAFPPLRGISIDNPKGPTADGSPSPVVEDVLPILAGQTDARLSSLKQWLVNLDVRSTSGEGVSAEDAAENRRLRDHFFDVFNAFVPGANVKFASVDRKSWQVNVTTNGIEVGIEQVSQGTSSLLGWVGALLQRMYEIHGAEKDIKRQAAVVLIDEIDAHLHPEWQQQIVGALKEQFPNVQFIATTHSPLIVGELELAQVYRVRWEGEEVVADHPTQPIKGMGVAGLLTSEMFGLTSTVDKTTQNLLERQRTLSGSDRPLSEDQKAALEEVNKELESLGFRYQVRDPEFSEYLRERHQRTREEAESQAPESAAKAAINPRVKDLVKTAIARATGRAQDRDG